MNERHGRLLEDVYWLTIHEGFPWKSSVDLHREGYDQEAIDLFNNGYLEMVVDDDLALGYTLTALGREYIEYEFE